MGVAACCVLANPPLQELSINCHSGCQCTLLAVTSHVAQFVRGRLSLCCEGAIPVHQMAKPLASVASVLAERISGSSAIGPSVPLSSLWCTGSPPPRATVLCFLRRLG